MSEQQDSQADAEPHQKDNEKQSQARIRIQEEQKSINQDLHRIILRYLTVIALSEKANKVNCCKLLLHFVSQLYPAKTEKQRRKSDAGGKLPPANEAEKEVERLIYLYDEGNADFQTTMLTFCMKELDLENNPDLRNALVESSAILEDVKETLLSTNAKDLEQLNTKAERLKESIRALRYQQTRSTISDLKTTLYEAKIQPTFVKLLENNTICRGFLELFIAKLSVINEPTQPDLDTPLHYAVRARNTKFIEWILNQTEVNVNSRNKQRKTALFVLCEQFDQIMKGVQGQANPTELGWIKATILKLLAKGADFNICGDQSRLPFELLKRHEIKEMKFLEMCKKTYNHAIVQVSKQRKLEFTQTDNVEVTVPLLEIFLRFRHDKEFKAMFDRLKVDDQNVQSVIKNLLHVAVDLGLNETVKLIITKAGSKIFAEKVPSIQLTYRVELKGLLKKVCEQGQVASLRLLLERINDRVLINDDPILVVALTTANSLAKNSDAQLKVLNCAKLLAANPKIYLSRADNFGNTALHVALKFGFTDIALELAKQSFAFLGVRNSKNLTPLDYASQDFCKQYFDECVETDKNRRYREEVRLNLNGLNPYYIKKGRTTENKQWKEQEKFPPFGRSNKPRFDTEMDVVQKMAESKELKPLLLHPVIYTFILIKWMRLSLWCYTNILVTILTTIFFGIYSVRFIAFGKDGLEFRILSAFGFLYIVVREILRVSMLRKQYSVRIENLFDYCIIITGTVSIIRDPEPLYCSLTIILFAVQIIRLIGFLPFNSISIYMHMFQTVAENFFKSLLLFCPLLLAFVYSFFLSYNNFSDPISTNATHEERFQSFGSLVDAAVKTLVMTIGEFDAAESEFVGGRTIIFVLFIFFAPIVVLNLINGLAVSDITAIRDESELISISKKVFILARYESCLRNVPSSVHWMFPTPFFKHYSFMIKIRPEEHRKIFVQPRVNKQFAGQTKGTNGNENVVTDNNDEENRPTDQQISNLAIRRLISEETPFIERNSFQEISIHIGCDEPQGESSSRQANSTSNVSEPVNHPRTDSVNIQELSEEKPLVQENPVQQTSIPLSEILTITAPQTKKLKNKKVQSEDFWQSVPKLKLDCLVVSGETPEKCLRSTKNKFLSSLKLFLMTSLDEHFMEETLRIADQNIKNEKSKAMGRKRVEGKPVGKGTKTSKD